MASFSTNFKKDKIGDLDSSEIDWDLFFHNTSDYISVHDKNFQIIRINKALANLLGKEPEEVIGKFCYEVFHGTSKPWPNCPHIRSIESKKDVSEEIDDPNIGIPLLVTTSPIFNKSGKLLGTVHISKNRTQQKQTEEALRKSANELERRVSERTVLLETEIADRKLAERELFFLNEINEIMLSGATESEIFQAITEGIRAYFEYDIADVFTMMEGGESLIWNTISVDGKIRKGLEKLTGMKGENLEIPIVPGSSFHEVVTKKKPVLLRDMKKMFEEFSNKKSFKKLAPVAARLSGFDTVIRVPLIVEGKVLGVIGIADKHPLKKRDVEIIERLSHQLAILISKVRTGEALKSSEERMKILFESAPDAVYLNDLKGNFVDGNIAAEELTGYTKEELIGKNFLKLKLLPKKQIPKAAALLAQNVLGKPTGPDELTIIRKDGTAVATEIRTFPVEIDGQTLTLGVARDITERKIAEDSLQESEESYRRIFENVNDVIIYVDKRGKILNVNEKVEDIIGHKREELLGRNILKFGIIGPKNLPKISKMFFESVRKGDVFRAGDRPINLMELELKHKNGSTVFVESSTSIIKKGGKTEGFLTIIRDITERKIAREELQKSEEKYSTLVEKGNDGIIIIQDGLLAFVNSKILEMTGLSEDDAVGKPFIDFVAPEFKEVMIDRYKKRMAGEEVESRYEIEILSKDGRSIPVEINAGVIDYEGKQADMAMIRDITERREAEEKLQETYAELEEAYEELKTLDELKSNVTSNVSHELRTPITIIKGTLEILQDENEPEKRSLLMSTALNALSRQNRVVGDLIEAAAKEKVEESLNLEPVDLNQLCTLRKKEFGPLLKKEEIKMEIQIKDDLPMVLADYNRLEHILENLISNAIKFNKKGGSITIKAVRKKDVIETCVSDTGIGITEDKQDKIFDRLYQIDSSSVREYGGTGLGLAIVKKLVEGQGGKVSVKSTKGKGSSFFFTLPIARGK